MNKKFTKLMAAFALLVFMTSSLAGWGQETPVYSLTFTKLTSGTNYNSYTAAHSITVSNKDWSVCGNQSLGAYLRVGGKNTTATNRTLTSSQVLVNKNIYKVVINHNGITNGSNTTMTVNSITVEGSTSSGFPSNSTISKTISSPNISSSGAFTFEPDNAWAANSYFRITVNYQVTTTNSANNCGINITSVNFYEEPAAPVTLAVAIVDHGTITATPSGGTAIDEGESNTSVNSGTSITLSSTPDAGYVLSGWDVYKTGEPATKVTVSNNSFSMPAYDVTVSAVFAQAFNFFYSATNGTVGVTLGGNNVANNSAIAEGTVLNINANPNSGYYFVRWDVTGTGSSVENSTLASTTFTMGAGDATLTAVFAESNEQQVTYTVATTSSVTITGNAPLGSTATFSQTYGTAQQMTSGNSMTLTLTGYQGRIIKGLTLSMHSNKSGGAGNMSFVVGTTTLASISTANFNSNSWYGAWSQNDFVNIVPTMTSTNYIIQPDDVVVITINATANSLFCKSFTIDYETSSEPEVIVSPIRQTVNYTEQTINSGSVFDISPLNITSPTYYIKYCDNNGNILNDNPYTWFSASVTDNEKVTYSVTVNNGNDRTAYFRVYTEVAGENVYSGLCSLIQNHKPKTYTLVQSTNDLVSGKRYIIVSGKSEGDAKAMGAQNGTTYRECIAVQVSSDQTITEAESVFGKLYEVVISGSGTNDEPWTVYSIKDDGYIRTTGAASGANISVEKNNTTNPTYGQWTISISSGAATVEAKSTNASRYFKYNTSSPRFACYQEDASNMGPVYLYMRNEDANTDTEYEFYSNTTLTSTSASPITIGNNESYTIHSPAILNVAYLANNTAANLIIEDGGQLITNCDVNATVKKTIAAHGATTADGGWYTIASPVVGDNYSTECLTVGTSYDLFLYNEPDHYWWNAQGATHPFSTLINGKGYLYANSEDQVIAFAGEMQASNTTNVSLLLSSSTTAGSLKGFNLLGNPFTCNVTSGKLTNTSTSADLTAYLAVENGSELVTYQISENPIKPGQGFFVQAVQTVGEQEVEFTNLVFNYATRSNAEQYQPAYIRIEAGNDSFTDRAYVQIGGGNTLRKMTIYDTTPKVYVMHNGKDYAAATVAEAQGELPLNFRANEDGQYTLTVNPEGVEMNYLHLIDNMTGNDIDLLQTPSYTFNATTRDYESRFRLVFAANNEDGVSTSSTTFAFYSNGNWMVNNEGEATLQVIDVMGRVLSSQTISGTAELSLNQQPGVYVLRLVNGNDVKTQKIVVR